MSTFKRLKREFVWQRLLIFLIHHYIFIRFTKLKHYLSLIKYITFKLGKSNWLIYFSSMRTARHFYWCRSANLVRRIQARWHTSNCGLFWNIFHRYSQDFERVTTTSCMWYDACAYSREWPSTSKRSGTTSVTVSRNWYVQHHSRKHSLCKCRSERIYIWRVFLLQTRVLCCQSKKQIV